MYQEEDGDPVPELEAELAIKDATIDEQAATIHALEGALKEWETKYDQLAARFKGHRRELRRAAVDTM